MAIDQEESGSLRVFFKAVTPKTTSSRPEARLPAYREWYKRASSRENASDLHGNGNCCPRVWIPANA